MPRYNVLLGCDQKYYDDWALPLLLSINRHNPWLNLHCHIVNPTKKNKLKFASITTEQRDFVTDEAKISYLQSVRFLAVAEKFNNAENVITLDADSICTRTIGQGAAIQRLFSKQHVLKHHKEDRWLAGFVVFNNNSFRQEYYKELTSVPFDDWKWGRDQTVLNTFVDEFKFEPVSKLWMSIGKVPRNTPSAFLTLKGEQKFTEKYLNGYNRYKG